MRVADILISVILVCSDVPRFGGKLTQPLRYLIMAAIGSELYAVGEIKRAIGAYTRSLFSST